MNLSDILNTIKPFASVAAAFIPGGPQVLAAVNAFLPDDKKLPDTATGQDIQDTVDSLPPEQRLALLSKKIDLEIAQEEGWTDRYKAMCSADGQSTRPQIALMLCRILSFEILAFTVWCFIYPDQMDNPVLWTIFATLTSVPAGVLMKYFGDLRREQHSRQGVKSESIMGIISKLK